MNRSMTITPGYYQQNKSGARILERTPGYYKIGQHFDDNNEIDYSGRILPAELDIFSELPQYVYENEDANLFLNALRKKIFQFDRTEFSGITLSKLSVTEHTSRTIILEWIYNYFRVFFGFDKYEGDFYGNVMNNPASGEFHNNMKMMTTDEFEDVAEANLSYVIMLARG